MTEPIFSSKLFAVSNRKAEIRAAASNPINQNLMQQLSYALDKSYQKMYQAYINIFNRFNI